MSTVVRLIFIPAYPRFLSCWAETWLKEDSRRMHGTTSPARPRPGIARWYAFLSCMCCVVSNGLVRFGVAINRSAKGIQLRVLALTWETCRNCVKSIFSDSKTVFAHDWFCYEYVNVIAILQPAWRLFISPLESLGNTYNWSWGRFLRFHNSWDTGRIAATKAIPWPSGVKVPQRGKNSLSAY